MGRRSKKPPLPRQLDITDIELSMDANPNQRQKPMKKNWILILTWIQNRKQYSSLTEDQDDIESEELDFSDFEETVMIDTPPKPENGDVSDDLEQELDLDLDLKMADDELPKAETALPSKEKEDVELEDLDFELDMELEGDAADDIADEDSEDVDLSDIEKMLEGDDGETETVSLSPEQVDVETEVEKWKESPDADDLMDQTGEIDLSDIMIDADRRRHGRRHRRRGA